MLKTPMFLVAAGLIVAAAVVNGAVTQRWAALTPNQARTDRLHSLTVRFEGWKAEDVPTEMPMNEMSVATSRRYTAPNGAGGVVTFISGPPGSVSTHTPDVCYPGSGYRTLRGPKRETADLPGGAPAAFYVADFEKKTATTQDRVRVRWAWTTDGAAWVAPDNPRWQFAKQLATAPVLYKVYVVTPLPDDADAHPDDSPAARGFARAVWEQYSAAAAAR